MKKIITLVGGFVLFGFGFGTATLLNPEHENKTVTPENQQVIETEKVKISYWDIENGDFDVMITPKDGRNVTTEWQLKEGSFYKQAYLVGREKEAQKEHIKKVNALFPDKNLTFDWDN